MFSPFVHLSPSTSLVTNTFSGSFWFAFCPIFSLFSTLPPAFQRSNACQCHIDLSVGLSRFGACGPLQPTSHHPSWTASASLSLCFMPQSFRTACVSVPLAVRHSVLGNSFSPSHLIRLSLPFKVRLFGEAPRQPSTPTFMPLCPLAWLSGGVCATLPCSCFSPCSVRCLFPPLGPHPQSAGWYLSSS